MTLKTLLTFVLASSLPAVGFWSAQAKPNASVEELVTVDESQLDRDIRQGKSFAESLGKIRPAVVSVYSEKKLSSSDSMMDPLLRRFFGNRVPQQPNPQPSQGLGSGVIVSENGYVLTNNHVIEGADSIKVMLASDVEYEAELVGADPLTDIAVLKIDAEDLPFAVLADSDQLEVGDIAFAIGNPLGVGQTATMGIVSATGRKDLNLIERGYENFIQTDASINRGNSGGALADAAGRLIGINTMILTDGRTTGNIGIGFAVPVNLAYSVMTSLVETGSVSRGYLGIGIQELDSDAAEWFGVEDRKGVLVSEVNPDTPAEEAGLQQGDVVVELDGEVVASPSELRLKVAQKGPGAKVKVTVVRDKERIDLYATLAALPGEFTVASNTFLEGVSASSLDDELRSQFGIASDVEGLVITEVSPNSPYASNLPVGMVIWKVNGREVRELGEASKLLKRDSKNMLLVNYQGIFRYVSIFVE